MSSSVRRRTRAAVIAGIGTSLLLGGGVLGTAVATAGTRAAATAAVPWASVGPGWVLDMYSTATRAKPAPTTLYLVSPSGAQYALHSWKASATAPYLIAWAGSKTQALFQSISARDGTVTGWEELNLRTGKATAVRFGAPNGVLLASNAGGVLRKLPVPGADARVGCMPERWWTKSTILVSCTPKSQAAPQLWLVPVSGARPTALTPVRKAGFDLGDFDAWKLSSGLYLQSYGACGTVEINKQAKNGSVTRVTVPGASDSPVVITATASRLLVWQAGCDGSGGQLVWFNPATKAETWLFKTGSGEVVAYNSTENRPLSW